MDKDLTLEELEVLFNYLVNYYKTIYNFNPESNRLSEFDLKKTIGQIIYLISKELKDKNHIIEYTHKFKILFNCDYSDFFDLSI